ncbi:calcium-binding protein [Falsiroseomonas oryzae]|uniref:calcium-binding protein n=1 Tax=Falsiroseomonas oryzae TaxID=2766473 RepID=UPI0022EAB53E|nr:calcium-binding protein [Roseomonas sp. MO-31]
MARLFIGPGLIAFPAFPDPATVDPFTLGFTSDATSLSFELEGYHFAFTGDFVDATTALTTLVPVPFPVPAFFLALAGVPGFAVPIVLESAEVTRIADGATVIGFDGASAALDLQQFFATLTDPANYTDDIITAYFGAVAAFTTLDLAAFDTPVVMGRPNAGVNGPAGERGVIAYAQEIDRFDFVELLGGAAGDRLGGAAGAESIDGQGGADLLLGRDGADVLQGGAENDVLDGGAGDDSLAGGAGDDVLAGRGGSNTLEGGTGADRFVIGAGPGTDRIEDFDAAGGDRVDVSALGLTLRALVQGLAGATADASGVTVTFAGRSLLFAGVADAATLQVQDFIRTVLPQSGGDVTVLGGEAGAALFGGDGHDVLLGGAGDDRLTGRLGDDALDGAAGADSLNGGWGNDVLFGGDGDDVLTGAVGDDFLDGGAGNDVIEGGPGTDCLTGAAGADIFVFRARDGEMDRVTDFEEGVDLIDIRALVAVTLSAGNLADHIRITSPGPTFLTRFLEVDRDGAGTRFGFVEVAQFDDVDDAVLTDAGNYLF